MSVTREQLFATLYRELKRLAQRELHRKGGPVQIGRTTLLHEFYLSLSERDDLSFPDRGRFLAYAARAMRGLIIDAARHRYRLKRGGGFAITRLDTHDELSIPEDTELTRISEALETIQTLEPALAELVDLKYFCGLSLAEIASLRRVSERTAQRDWEKARLLLSKLLTDMR
jgi:RNA polymerase sigma factor (TIGR02999 family)